jgi:hypothetical protein
MAHGNQGNDEGAEDNDNNDEASGDDEEFIDIDTLDFDELVDPQLKELPTMSNLSMTQL